jgi:hypothetical protein
MGNKRSTCKLLGGNPNGMMERDIFEDLSIRRRVILKWVLRKWIGIT